VDEGYLRAGWEPGGLLAGVRKGELVVHAGGQPVLIDTLDWHEPAPGVHIAWVEDNGRMAAIHCTNSVGEVLTVELHRPEQRLIVRRRATEDWQWWCQGAPTQKDSGLKWKSGVVLRVVSGEIESYEPRGYEPILSVGFGKLRLADPSPMAYAKCSVHPAANHEIVVEAKMGPGRRSTPVSQ